MTFLAYNAIIYKTVLKEQSMDLKYYLTEQIKKHPSILPCDVAKICYQAAMGAEHLLSDVDAAKRFFDAEMAATKAEDGELFECLSDEICRVNFGAWKARKLPDDALFDAFVATARVKRGENELLVRYLDEAGACISDASFSLEEWQSFLSDYKAAGMPAVHHSARYRECERPAYRIVDREFLCKIEGLEAESAVHKD